MTLTKSDDFLKRTTYERYEPADNDDAFLGLMSDGEDGGGDSDDDVYVAAASTLSATAARLAAFGSPGEGGKVAAACLSPSEAPSRNLPSKADFQKELKAQMALLLKEELTQAQEGAYGKGGNSYAAPGTSPRTHEYYKTTAAVAAAPITIQHPPPPDKSEKDNRGLRLSSLAKPLAPPPEKKINKDDEGYMEALLLGGVGTFTY